MPSIAYERFAQCTPHPLLCVGAEGRVLLANAAAEALRAGWRDPERLPSELWRQVVAARARGVDHGLVVAGRGLPPFELVFDGPEAAWLFGRGADDRIVEQVRAAQRTKAAFLANMSHELRTPLNAILGYTELLTEEVRDGHREGLLGDLGKVRGAAEHLLRLINDILDVSKIEAGRVQVFAEDFDVPELVQEVVARVQPTLDAHGDGLRIEVDLEPTRVRADRSKVLQVLHTLVDNAAKFTRDGQVVVRVEGLTLGGRSHLALAVEDTGIGMDAAQLAQLYEAFTQADPSTTRQHGGTGLGLALCRLLVDLLDGEIEVHSVVGEGTTFRVVVPVEAVVEVPEPEPAVAVVGEGERTVLVIDDEPTVRDLLARFLRKEGYRVLLAADGAAGLQAARRERPDAITLDVMMPQLDGWDVLKRLKADPETASIPVVMCSIVDNTGLGFALGASDYITKPIDRRALLRALRRFRESDGHLLLVDDSADVRDVLTRALRRDGWAVDAFADGPGALRWLRSHRPDAILLDLLMPGMDGFAFLDRLRADADLATIPVLVVTAKDLTPIDWMRLQGGVEHVVAKSGRDLRQLSDELHTLLSGTDLS